MTKEEAKAAIMRGEKVTHRYFTPEEFIKLAGDGSGMYKTEEGYYVSPFLFWSDRRHENFAQDWSVWQEPHHQIIKSSN